MPTIKNSAFTPHTIRVHPKHGFNETNNSKRVNRRLVGIEFGGASCKRSVTSARWVHISAMTTFPEAPR